MLRGTYSMSSLIIRERNKAGKRLARARARGESTTGELERRYAALCRQCDNDREAANLAWLLGDEERHPARHARATTALLAAYGEGKSPRAARAQMVAAISRDLHTPATWDGSVAATCGQVAWGGGTADMGEPGTQQPWGTGGFIYNSGGLDIRGSVTGHGGDHITDPRGQELLYASMSVTPTQTDAVFV